MCARSQIGVLGGCDCGWLRMAERLLRCSLMAVSDVCYQRHVGIKMAGRKIQNMSCPARLIHTCTYKLRALESAALAAAEYGLAATIHEP